MPARSKSLCETTSASAGSSRSVGMKYCDQRIEKHSRLANESKQLSNAASPPDVRKGSAFPECLLLSLRLRLQSSRGGASRIHLKGCDGKAEPYRTSDGKPRTIRWFATVEALM